MSFNYKGISVVITDCIEVDGINIMLVTNETTLHSIQVEIDNYLTKAM